MSGEKGSGTKKKSVFNVYISKILIFLLIALAVSAIAIIAVRPIVTKYIHKAEEAYSIDTDDIVTVDNSFSPNSLDSMPSAKDYGYGKKLAVMTCDRIGLNTSVYSGSIRTSMRYGVGISTEYSLFGGEGVSFVTGYAQADFEPLENIEEGDVIEVVTEYGTYHYTVDNILTAKSNEIKLDKYSKGTLVLSAIEPMISDEWGNSLVVVASEGEVH